jgi:multicomponent Na+:H+ antiporter subunit F
MIESIDSIVTTVALVLVAALMFPLLLTIFRMVVGPGYADRFIALDMLTAIAVATAALTAVVTGRREFLDVAFGVALIGFLATCALAGLLERMTGDKQ